jgi:hypothetical protein
MTNAHAHHVVEQILKHEVVVVVRDHGSVQPVRAVTKET